MKVLQAAALIAVIVLCAYIGLTWTTFHTYIVHEPEMRPAVQGTPRVIAAPEPPQLPAPPPGPRRVSQTVSFMPGQYIDLKNREFRKIEIHSEFPIRVATGSCHNDYTVEFICFGDASDIFILDMRPKPVFSAPRGNLITLTLIEF